MDTVSLNPEALLKTTILCHFLGWWHTTVLMKVFAAKNRVQSSNALVSGKKEFQSDDSVFPSAYGHTCLSGHQLVTALPAVSLRAVARWGRAI